MKYFEWNDLKYKELLQRSGISFEDVLFFIERGEILDILEHTNQTKYPDQKYFVLDIDDHVYFVPFVEDETKVFLKTVIPSRKLTKNIFQKMKNSLNMEESAILEEIESEELRSIPNLIEAKSKYSAFASQTLKKDKRINIRISDKDLQLIQRKALSEGMPYQTLISSLLHKYITGKLIES